MNPIVFSLRSILPPLLRFAKQSGVGRQRSFVFSAAAELAPTASSGLTHPRRPDIVPTIVGTSGFPKIRKLLWLKSTFATKTIGFIAIGVQTCLNYDIVSDGNTISRFDF